MHIRTLLFLLVAMFAGVVNGGYRPRSDCDNPLSLITGEKKTGIIRDTITIRINGELVARTKTANLSGNFQLNGKYRGYVVNAN